ncbi:MAG TPA: hypothetical protein VKW76_02530 [Candidatus Binatia bacterium]|nr:hypothetical protein [Candidatus Binatia bacterium]
MWRTIREALGRLFEGAPHPHAHHPRVVHRVALECPHGQGRIEVDLVLGADGRPAGVLHSSGRPRCDRCDEICLGGGKARAEPDVVLLLPPGAPADEID